MRTELSDDGAAESPASDTARSVLMTMLGELVIPAGEPVWTYSILYVLTGLGITEQNGRQALARLARQGLIVSEKVGREVRWEATVEAEEAVESIACRAESLARPPRHWDGNAIFVNIIVPREKKAQRRRLYESLAWVGFGNPMPGLWTSPHVDRIEEARSVIDSLGLRDTAIVSIGRLADCGLTTPEIIERAWDLQSMRRHYEELICKYESMTPRQGDDILFSYMSLVHDWRRFPMVDPQLPIDVLPNWIGRTAGATFLRLRSKWRPGMLERWSDLLGLTLTCTQCG